MTREEAIKWLEYERNRWESDCKSIHPTKEALKMAIEALGQEPILDKIRAEIMMKDGLEEALEIIDKYKADMRGEE